MNSAGLGPDEAAKREARKNRFQNEQKEWKKKCSVPIQNRVAHTGGTITSNKEEALAKFLQRKQEAGQQLDPNMLRHLSEHIESSPRAKAAPTDPPSSTAPHHVSIRSSSTAEGVTRKMEKLTMRSGAAGGALTNATNTTAPRAPANDGQPLTKQQQKNAKRAEKRAQKRQEAAAASGGAC